MSNQKQEVRPIDKKTIYIGSAIGATAFMATIKTVATVINKTVAFVLENVL